LVKIDFYDLKLIIVFKLIIIYSITINMLAVMTPQEIQFAKSNTTLLSLVIQFFEFINSEIDEDKEKYD